MDGTVDHVESLGGAPGASSAAPVRQSADAAPPEPAYPPAAPVPTQSGPKGLRFDFNEGCRVTLPESEHPWRVRISDLTRAGFLKARILGQVA